MKTIYLLLIALFSITSCTEDENQLRNDNDRKITGQWQLIEIYDGGSPSPTTIVQDGEIISFGNDNSFSNSDFNCIGSYSLSSAEIVTIELLCQNSNVMNFTYLIENENLFLTSHPNSCDEGCYNKYQKVNVNE